MEEIADWDKVAKDLPGVKWIVSVLPSCRGQRPRDDSVPFPFPATGPHPASIRVGGSERDPGRAESGLRGLPFGFIGYGPEHPSLEMHCGALDFSLPGAV